jgi:hypothetical protein
MDIGGWKTRSIFEHHHISDEKAKEAAARKMAAQRATLGLTTLLTTGEVDEPNIYANNKPN